MNAMSCATLARRNIVYGGAKQLLKGVILHLFHFLSRNTCIAEPRELGGMRLVKCQIWEAGKEIE